jgi:tRNA (mo5U34)-methyltransferase
MVSRKLGQSGGVRARARTLRLDVEGRDVDLAEISRESVGVFDLVLFCGVLHHLRDPLGTLTSISSVCSHTLVVETHVDALYVERPAMIFYPTIELANDPTNWWGPNPACVTAMPHDAGFAGVECVPNPAHENRAIFHAYRH